MFDWSLDRNIFEIQEDLLGNWTDLDTVEEDFGGSEFGSLIANIARVVNLIAASTRLSYTMRILFFQ